MSYGFPSPQDGSSSPRPPAPPNRKLFLIVAIAIAVFLLRGGLSGVQPEGAPGTAPGPVGAPRPGAPRPGAPRPGAPRETTDSGAPRPFERPRGAIPGGRTEDEASDSGDWSLHEVDAPPTSKRSSAAETEAEQGDWSLEEVDVRKPRDEVEGDASKNGRSDERDGRKKGPAGVRTEEGDWSIEQVE